LKDVAGESYRRSVRLIVSKSITQSLGGKERLSAIKRGKANWIGHTLRRNCLLKHVMKREIEGTRRRGRRGVQLLDVVKEKKIY
jgi:hypothetical protein